MKISKLISGSYSVIQHTKSQYKLVLCSDIMTQKQMLNVICKRF